MKAENPLVQLLRSGFVLVEQNSQFTFWDSVAGRLVADDLAKPQSHADVQTLMGNSELIQGLAHLDNEWAGGSDGRVRKVIFHVSNQEIADNVYRTSQVISNLNADAAQPSERVPPDTFYELPLLTIFKYLPDEDGPMVTAVKVGRSTAIIGIMVDANKNLVNVLSYDFKGEKIRLRKNTMVVKIK